MSTAGHAALIVRTELRRRLRALSGAQLVATLIAGLFLLLMAGGGVVFAFVAGGQVAAGNVESPTATARLVAGLAPVAVGAFTAIRAVQLTGVPVAADGLLLAASHREAVLGLLGTELALTLGVVGGPVLAGAVAFGIGAGSPTSALLVAAALLVLLTGGVVAGYAAGLAVRNAIARSALLARYKTAIGVALFVAYFVVVARGAESAAAFGGIAGAAAGTPLGWFADLGLVTVAADADPTLAAGAVGLTAVGLPVGVAVCSRLADSLWYSQPVQPAGESTTDSRMTGGLLGLPRPMVRIARKSWLRAWRSPLRLIYVLYPLLAFVTPLLEAVETGAVPRSLPPLVALYGAWATGAAFTLNPIGDEGPVLPVTATTPVGGWTFVAGLCLAGVTIGTPLVVALAVGTALLAGTGPAALVGLAVLAGLLPALAAAIATAPGMVFPRREPAQVFRGRQAVVPSIYGFLVYSVVLLVVAVPGLAVGLPGGRSALAGLTGLGPTAVLVAGVGSTVLLAGAVATVSVQYAAGRFDRYTVD